MLHGKSLCIVGGTGYLGSAIARQAFYLGAKVSSISRSGAPKQLQEWQKNIEYIQADASNPDSFEVQLLQSDATIYTIGTLIDTSITKRSNPGEPGTYEHLNRDCAMKIGNKLNDFSVQKKLVYLSAQGHPPFIHRYIETKEQAEKYLLDLNNVKTCVLKPGFIYSYQERKWSIPLKYTLDAWGCIHSFIGKSIPQNTLMNQLYNELYVEKSIQLEAVVNAAIYSALHESSNGKIWFNSDMEKYQDRLQDLKDQ
ncbi:nad-dependent epimerase dehydratase, putative [Ichthyophthirius multifiliis]|uniref:Nad-dependent epimerase dehydratase, putative n=1 Tax=Ichthyophthirius multifiliis TaxID=5932 RepID=G0QWJ3_ICHMU|nr:nad-dependent epimerase dehydratase, putative [Ichthyophthirius multifiliis]EGR30406.1 nad-dependent epimerase dehydratase, putative [Ichthyophthirius multifiliis]|eukprot:XP_004031993.1 nad-dependent epimerase dehydratase, putative [Ichthyophthirius multifiliis]